MEKDISPEERLLRLIRGEKKEKSFKIPLEEKSKDSLSKRIIPKVTSFKIPRIKKLLWVLLILSFVYLLISFTLPIFSPKEIKLSQSVKIGKDKNEETKIESKPYSLYQERITKQIFGPSSIQLPLSEGPTASAGIEEIRDLNLLGIISGENPQAIIEDKKNQKTYFLKQGESIGSFQLETIGDGRIILNFHGQRFDLFL